MDDRALAAAADRRACDRRCAGAAGGQTRAAVWKRIEALREAGVADRGPGRPRLPPGAAAGPARCGGDPGGTAARRAGRPGRAGSRLDHRFDQFANCCAGPPPSAAPLVLLAERQTGGRGRRGREWTSPLAAHLYLSLSRQFGGGLARLGGLSLVAGIAAAEALQELGFSGVRLKWPNDLVVTDAEGVLRKLGGILVEGGGEHAGPVRAVIGLGINVRMPEVVAARIDQPWCDLSTLAGSMSAPTRNTVAAAVLARLAACAGGIRQRAVWRRSLPRYAALDALAGQDVGVHGATVDAARHRARPGRRWCTAGATGQWRRTAFPCR